MVIRNPALLHWLEIAMSLSTGARGETEVKGGNHQVVSLLRTVEIPERVAITGIVCPRRLQEDSSWRCRDTRPTLLEFANSRRRGRFLASADKIKSVIKAEATIEPDDTAISKIKDGGEKGDRQDSVSRGRNSPN